MQDRVAEVLAQRATLNRGAGLGVLLSILLHVGIMGTAIYAALHAAPPQAATMVSIKFMPVEKAAAPKTERRAEARPLSETAQPKIAEPKPVVEKPPETPKKPEKSTVPLSPFGQSTKKGSETPAATPPKPAPPTTDNRQPTTTTTDIAVGNFGVTGIEGGDFPHALYLQAMHRVIGLKWIRPTVPPGVEVVVFLRILRDGTIAEARVEKPSGNSTFDRAALSAVRSASPLNPLPFAYPNRELGIYLTLK